MKNEKKSSPKSMTAEQLAEFYLKKWQDAAVPMEEGEYAVQMVNENPCYFITSKPRIFSLARKKCLEKTQFMCQVKGKNGTNSEKQKAVNLSANGVGHTYKVSRLMKEYFPLSQFNPKQEKIQCHHIEPYDVEKGEANNRVENLQCVGKKVHRNIFTPLQNATLTPEGMELKNEKDFLKNMIEMGEHLEAPVAVCSKVDRETGEVKAVWGEDEVTTLLKNNWDKLKDFFHAVQAANTAYQEEERRKKMRADMKRLEEHPEDVEYIDTVNQEVKFKGEKG